MPCNLVYCDSVTLLVILALAFRFTAGLTDPAMTPAESSSVPISIEVRRGFNAATYATRIVDNPESWAANIEKTVFIARTHHTNSGAFMLGIQFGFSYRVDEFRRNKETKNRDALRILVAEGTLARLEYEDSKRALGVSDADVVRILNIPISSFATWKASDETTDFDRTVVDPTRWLRI
jgi:hypothetical protein